MNIAVAGKPAPESGLERSVLEGLRKRQKTISSKWLYDEEGSRLFDAITELPEYYPTRTEIGILKDRLPELSGLVPNSAALMELGSGSSDKTRLVLDALPGLDTYIPVDISADYLEGVLEGLATSYPRLKVHPLVGDFTGSLTIPGAAVARPKLLFFPGSTIGNFTSEEALGLLRAFTQLSGVVAFAVGVDLRKDRQTLVRAYDDAAGVTAAFNLNLLRRLNRELGANFDLDAFSHEARWNDEDSRIEMHLASKADQTVKVAGETFRFRGGETIHTENSHKYSIAGFRDLAFRAGWRSADLWTDAEGLFSVHILQPA